MDRVGLAPTKFKTADLQSAPVAAWVTIRKADRKGFEPLDSLTTIGGLVNRSIRPLCHLSKSG